MSGPCETCNCSVIDDACLRRLSLRGDEAMTRLNTAQAKWIVHVVNNQVHAIDVLHWSTPLPRPAGIYWRRTGGKTWRVEVVR